MKIKKIIYSAAAVVTATSLSLCALACGDDESSWTPPANTYQYDVPQDYCRTYYEVFVRSFADGDGDSVGDIRGLINNLDYLNDGNDKTMTDLGINGIWMMPINMSPSYHKYDVSDYYSIDDEYGTLDDFDDLVKACNERDIWIQMDLVLNHTSTQHEWFKAAKEAAKDGNDPETDPDMRKYNFVRAETKPTEGKWYSVGGAPGYYYLANFDSGMPDLNLKNSSVKREIKKIVDFWLERGVRSFRLDAVPWAFANDVLYNEDNGEFWTWFNDYCNEKGAEVFGADGDGIARYCYNVGEVYGNNAAIPDFFGTGMSCFNYEMGGGASATFLNAATGWSANGAVSVTANIADVQKAALDQDENAILSNFLSNHDNNRSGGFLSYDPVQIKRAAAFYLLAPGNPYIYYGEEIGMAGSGEDPNKRLPFVWGDNKSGHSVTTPPGANYDTSDIGIVGQSVQTGQPGSILTYYRNAIRLRNRFPEIGRGRITGYALDANGKPFVMSDDDPRYVDTNPDNAFIAVYTLAWKDRTVLIVHNIADEAKSVDLSDFAGYSVVGELEASGGSVALNNGALKLPANSVAVLKPKA